MSVSPISLPLLSVKSELDSSLATISRELEDFFTSEQNAQSLTDAMAELHRVSGVLQMLQLRGLVVFCSELETLLQELSAHPQDATAMRQDTIHRALFGLTHYLDALAAGAPNATLRLFREYQEILQARGLEMAFEVDLFFPDLQAELPPSLLQEAQLEDASTHIKTSRSQYQQCLLKWLRQDDPGEALRCMMAAVRVVLTCVDQDQSRAFWWVAGGLLNCVLHEGVPPELNVKKSLSRIDQKMRSLLENGAFDDDAALSEMLYLVARSHTVSTTVESIKQTFDLDTYLPEAPPLPPSETTALLNNMRAQLAIANETWEHCVTDDTAACGKFKEQAEQLYLLSEQLDRDTLQFLCKQIHAMCAHSDTQEHAQRIEMDMAMALLLLESGIDHYQHLGSGFHEQTRILSMRLQSSITRIPEDAGKLAHLVSLYCEMELREVMSPLAVEMQSNLQHIEQGLNAFFGDAAKRAELLQINRLMSQVQGGLHILSLDIAEQLLVTLRRITDRYHQGDAPSTKEMRTVASAVSMMEDYVHGLSLGQKPDPIALSMALTELAEVSANVGGAAEEASANEEPVAPLGVSIRSGNVDAELLEVFLEEAQEVLETLRANLEISVLHQDSREPWVTMRRAFHTLKGSGRMVGLTELGEVAWAIERAMNKWLAENNPATPTLLEMVGDAEVLFQHWVDMLKSGSTTAHIDTSRLLLMADCVENGKELPRPAAPMTAHEPAVLPEPATPPTPVFSLELETPTGSAIAPEPSVLPELAVSPETAFSLELEEPAKPAIAAEPATPPTPAFSLELEMPTVPVVVPEPVAFPELAVSPETAFSLELEEPTAPAIAPEPATSLKPATPPTPEFSLELEVPTVPAVVPEPAVFPELEVSPETAFTLELGELPELATPQAPAAAPEVPAEEAPIQIGSVSIAPVLFNIASEEAAERVHALQVHLADLRKDAAHVVPYDFMRAAHTLAGVNRTMGLVAIAELAYNLELWLEVRVDKRGVVDDRQLALLDEVTTRLDALCAAVRNREEPQAQPELIARLVADRETAATLQTLAAKSVMPAEETPSSPTPAAPISPPAAAQELSPAPTMAVPQPAGKHERVVHDDVDEQLLPIFLEEANELYPQIGSTLRAWHDTPADAQLGRNLQRSLHTLKGSARMAGAMRLGELTHIVEDRVDLAISKNVLDDAFWNEMDGFLDRIAHAIEQIQNPQALPAAVETPAHAAAAGSAAVAVAAPAAAHALEIGAERAMQAALLRVRSDTVDRLVNEAGEVSVARSRAETELREFKNSVLELTESVHRLRKQLREIEIHAEGQMQARVAVSGDSAEKFDPLEFDRFTRFQELTRFMGESVHDVQTVQQSLLKNLDETEAALTAQSHLNRDLQQGLMAIRMVPFSSISERLYRIVRQTGKELGKRANLELMGTEIELDRSVLEKMTAPFEHLLRNAIAHGLETSEQRAQAGKPAIGEIRLSLRHESNEVVFELSDDGAGLNIARIRQKALENGTISADEEVSDEQVMQLIFTAGLSTAQEITEVSGRGVGMDVVRSEITALGGRIDVASEAGHGVRFSIRLPLTLAVTKTLLIRSGSSTYAVPSTMVENVQQLKPNELKEVYLQQYVDWQGRRYGLHYLPRLLGDDQTEVVGQAHSPVLLLRSGEHRIALHVDALLGNQEVVVKNIGPQLARLPGIAGATVSGSGAVILIINPVAFTQRILPTHKQVPVATAVEAVRSVPLVMVVDDSLTVRKITTRLLERAGYQVVTAKDGVDALEQLTDISPNVMLLDVEMPRMDGFELAKRLRQDSKTKSLPIIMITSRTAEKHRNYALELGVNEYLGKPYQEEELLQHIARFVNQGS